MQTAGKLEDKNKNNRETSRIKVDLILRQTNQLKKTNQIKNIIRPSQDRIALIQIKNNLKTKTGFIRQAIKHLKHNTTL